MSRPKLEHRLRWLVPAALLAVAPKCVLCALAYAGLGAAAGLGGPELCGAGDGGKTATLVLPAILGLAFIAAWLLGLALRRARCQHFPESSTYPPIPASHAPLC